MAQSGKILLKGALAGIVGLLLLLLLVGLVVVYTGAYNVAATDEHTSVVRWASAELCKVVVKAQRTTEVCSSVAATL